MRIRQFPDRSPKVAGVPECRPIIAGPLLPRIAGYTAGGRYFASGRDDGWRAGAGLPAEYALSSWDRLRPRGDVHISRIFSEEARSVARTTSHAAWLDAARSPVVC